MRKSNILLLALLLLTVTGCRLKRPDDVMSPKKMEQFLYDYHLAQAISQDLPREEKYMTRAYIDWAYNRNHVTHEQFERSLVWYTRYPKELARVYKRLSNRLEDEYKEVSRSLSQIEKKSVIIESGDSVDLWYLDRTALLNSSSFMDKVTYKIGYDTTFHVGDTVVLSMNNTFVPDTVGKPQYAYMSLSAMYRDSIATVDTILRAGGNVALRLVLDDMDDISTLSGSINYLDSTKSRSGILMVTGIGLMRYHSKVKELPADTVSVESETPAAEL